MTQFKLQAVCAVCFNTHKLYANGSLVRHGFQIYDRRNGVFGLAWQTGPCNGISFPHFGISTEGTKWALNQARIALAHATEQVEQLNARPTLTWSVDPSRRLYKQGFRVDIRIAPGTDDVQHAKVTDYMSDWNGNSHATFHIPSYESLLNTRLSKWNNKIRGCNQSIAFYEEAIATWAPCDAVPVKVAVKLHKRSTWKRTDTLAPLCKRWQLRGLNGSCDYAATDEEVTCKACLRSMAAQAKEAAKNAKRVEKALTVKKGAGRVLLAEMIELGRSPDAYDLNAMSRLESAGLVKSEGGHSPNGWVKPYYVPTDAGREALKGTR